jgi:hypothetical protein
MARSRASAILLIAVLVAPLALLAAACSRGGGEQQLLNQFFRAARARDNMTLAMMPAVSIDPREHGHVERFSVTNVSEDQRRELDLKALVAAEQKARDEENAFSARKKEYQDANLEIIEQVLKLERTESPRMNAAQQKVKEEWDKWREDTTVYARAVSDARAALLSAAGPIEASLSQPGAPQFNPSAFEGALITKDVTIDATVVSPEGQSSQKELTIRMQRAEGTLNGQAANGRWIITRIQGL